jgi:hypothetical protein
MVEILSLSRARKARDRAEQRRVAEENRVRFGRTRSERDAAEKTEEIAVRRLDAHRLVGPDGDDT